MRYALFVAKKPHYAVMRHAPSILDLLLCGYTYAHNSKTHNS
jgi:hypothetical protein